MVDKKSLTKSGGRAARPAAFVKRKLFTTLHYLLFARFLFHVKFFAGGHHVPEVRVSLGELVGVSEIEFITGQPTEPAILCTQEPAQANKPIHVMRMVFMCARPFRTENRPMLTDTIASAAARVGVGFQGHVHLHANNITRKGPSVKRFFHFSCNAHTRTLPARQRVL